MRPILLATDFGISGPYVDQLKSAIYNIAPKSKVIDFTHDLPKFNPKPSAYLLASYFEYLPAKTILVGVVDPGVGSSREAIIVEGDGFSFIGSNNSLFSIITRKLSNNSISKIMLTSIPISETFHGRDIFAPTAARIALSDQISTEILNNEALIGIGWPKELCEIIYIDKYGNAVTGIDG